MRILIFLFLVTALMASPIRFLTIDSVDITGQDGYVYIHATCDDYDGGLFKKSQFTSWQEAGTVKGGKPPQSLTMGVSYKVLSRGKYHHDFTLRVPYAPEVNGDSLRFSIRFHADFAGRWGTYYIGIINSPGGTYGCQGFGEGYYFPRPLTIITSSEGERQKVSDSLSCTYRSNVIRSSLYKGRIFETSSTKEERWYLFEMHSLLNPKHKQDPLIPPSQRLEALDKIFKKRGGLIHASLHGHCLDHYNDWQYVIPMSEVVEIPELYDDNFMYEDSAKIIWESDSLRLFSWRFDHEKSFMAFIGDLKPRTFIYLEKLDENGSSFYFITETKGEVIPITIRDTSNTFSIYLEERNHTKENLDFYTSDVRKFALVGDTIQIEELFSTDNEFGKRLCFAHADFGFSIVQMQNDSILETKAVLYEGIEAF